MINKILDRIPAKKYVFAILTLFVGIVISGEATKRIEADSRTLWFLVGLGLTIGAAILVWYKTEDWLNSNKEE